MLFAALLSIVNIAFAADPNDDFSSIVRQSEPLSPGDELASFKVPDGFQVQLVAAEPDIDKPINIAFDDRGRLWVTCSTQYPISAKDSAQGRDSIKILEDTTGDGRADKITTFADGLNIPIGLYPYQDGVICFSIPNILFLRDSDGDDRADERRVLYGPFDTTRDTHGMCNAFTRGFDGWLYACHGFNNISSVAGADGHEIAMSSGNTFRMKLDGSRIEHFTHGQVNPFGLAFDQFGDLFSADCHTKPVTLLMQGGYNPSFGAPHDGLGFVPAVMDHLHGSTAIGGIAINQADDFPAEYRNNAFGGNVMTGRINRNDLVHQGGSVIASEQPDFLISKDPWFRPVDLTFSPDGSLYVADFYNRVIGHYEVPLDHPGRDRHRGRIWKITYAAGSQSGSIATSIQGLLQELVDENLSRRMKACDRLVDQFGPMAVAPTDSFIRSTNDPRAAAHALWVLHRLDAMKESHLIAALNSESELQRVHAFRVLGETKPAVFKELPQWLADGLQDPSHLVVRTAAMAMCHHQAATFAPLILDQLSSTVKNDPHLRHALRMALRHQLRDPVLFEAATRNSNESFADEILRVCLAIPATHSAEFVVTRIGNATERSGIELSEVVRFAARHVSEDSVPSLVDACRDSKNNFPLAKQEQLLRSIMDGREQQGATKLSGACRRWGLDLVRDYLQLDAKGNLPSETTTPLPWTSSDLDGSPRSDAVWQLSRRRKAADSGDPVLLYSSLPTGESKTGVHRSAPFKLSQPFEFYLAGHDGNPNQPLGTKNFVRLIDVETETTLATWPAPRNDVAQRIHWESAAAADKFVRVEIVDGDSAGAYAWIAAGSFSVPELNPSPRRQRQRAAAQLAFDASLAETRPLFAELLRRQLTDPVSSKLFALAMLGKDSDATERALAEALSITSLTASHRIAIQVALQQTRSDELTIGLIMGSISRSQQEQLATVLSQDRDGVSRLRLLAESGVLSHRVLNHPVVRQQWESIAKDRVHAKLSELADAVKPTSEQDLAKVAEWKQRVIQHRGDIDRGSKLFTKHCAICHQVSGVGAEVGPNVDGVGQRGLDRLLEDVLLPNQNVDVAFRSSTILTSEGNVVTGLIKRDEGERLVLVTTEAKEITVMKSDIEQQRKSDASPMPNGFADSFDSQQSADLFAYLLSLKAKEQ